MVTLPVLTRFEFLFVIDLSVCFLIGLYYISWMLGEKADSMQSSKKIPHWNFFYKKMEASEFEILYSNVIYIG